MDKLYIVDAVAFLYRSYYAIKGMTNPKGESTNALYGFIRSLEKLKKDFSPTHLVAVFDGPKNTAARKALYADYKSHRKPMPEDLAVQLDWAREYCVDAGIPMLSLPGVEADDVMGVIAKWGEKQSSHVYLCSSDKDLGQLVSKNVSMLNVHKDNLIIDEKGVEASFGVKPCQIIDYLAIVGDASDNIPGIEGMGPKTAVSLLQEFTSLNNLYDNLDQISNVKRREKLIEQKDKAFLSQTLATLHLDIDVETSGDAFALKEPNIDKLKELYQEMHFMTLLKSLTPNAPQEKVNYHIIQDEKALDLLIKNLTREKEICIDTETDRLDPISAEVIGIGFCTKKGTAHYVPLNGSIPKETVITKCKPLLESRKIGFFGHNIKYDLHTLLNLGICVTNISFDTIIASYLLSPSSRHNLDTLALDKFGIKKIAIKELIGSGKKEKSLRDIPIDQVGNYCCEDVDVTYQLKELFEEELKTANLHSIFTKLELPLIPILLLMERHGMFVDKQALQSLSKTFAREISHQMSTIHEMAGEEFNIKSPKQLRHILFDVLEIPPVGKRGKEGYSTRADVLEKLSQEHAIAKHILRYRFFEKLRSTYVDTLPLQISPVTNRIHCSFSQTTAATGRLACQDPNLQNIPIRSPEGRKIREAFLPEKKGWSYLSADYSQIELRLMAHLSNDPKLIEAFNKGEDIHAATASVIFETPLSQVTKAMRSQAKAVNFGVMYGQQAYGLSELLGIDFKAAAKFIKSYFEKYPDVKNFLEKCKQDARDNGYSITLFGRKRPLPDINSTNGMVRSSAERLAVNTPLQGSQADIIKQAMIEIGYVLSQKKLGYMVLQIHDELIFEVPDEKINELKDLITSIMENVITLKVPLTVNTSFGKNWAEC